MWVCVRERTQNITVALSDSGLFPFPQLHLLPSPLARPWVFQSLMVKALFLPQDLEPYSHSQPPSHPSVWPECHLLREAFLAVLSTPALLL